MAHFTFLRASAKEEAEKGEVGGTSTQGMFIAGFLVVESLQKTPLGGSRRIDLILYEDLYIVELYIPYLEGGACGTHLKIFFFI